LSNSFGNTYILIPRIQREVLQFCLRQKFLNPVKLKVPMLLINIQKIHEQTVSRKSTANQWSMIYNQTATDFKGTCYKQNKTNKDILLID